VLTIRAIEDALRTFGADEIVICAHPGAPTSSPGRDIVAAARERFALPIEHVVVDTEAGRDRAPGGLTISCRV
jgi:hypothetical protein